MTGTTLSANARTGNCLRERLDQLMTRIAEACAKSAREPEDVRLLAVSKTVAVERLREAQALGLNCFGENYLQEALSKIAALDPRPEWHFIGPLQSNKTREVAAHFDWVHSIDRLRIARRLDAQRPAELAALNICLQVNISGEHSKSGVSPDQLPELIDGVRALPRLRLQGLMCLPLASNDPAVQRASFRRLRELRDNLLPETTTLSMGMSADLEAAIAEGSTLIRIGSALFGPRPQKHSPKT